MKPFLFIDSLTAKATRGSRRFTKFFPADLAEIHRFFKRGGILYYELVLTTKAIRGFHEGHK